MNQKKYIPLLKKLLPYFVAAVVFIALTLIYLLPALQGKVLSQSDVTKWRWGATEIIEWSKAHPNQPINWTNSMFGGMPGYQIAGTYPSNGFTRATDKVYDFVKSATHLFFKGTYSNLIGYFIGFMILLLAFGVDVWLAILGALAMAFSSYFFLIIPAGHDTKSLALGYLPALVGGFRLIFRKKYIIGMALVMLYSSISLTLHPQMTYYIFMMMAIFGIAELWIHIKEKRLKDLCVALGCFLVALLVGFGSRYVETKTNSEYLKETMRGGHSDLVAAPSAGSSSEVSSKGLSFDYVTAWSYGVDETLTFLVPNYMGAASSYDAGVNSSLYKGMVAKGVDRGQAKQIASAAPLYWGDQPFTAGPVYMGAIVMLLFVIGLMVCKGPYKWAIVAATVFSILLSWGYHFTPLTKLFYNYFPLYAKFRTVSSILVVAEITIPLLGLLGLQKIMSGEVERQSLPRIIGISTAIVGGTALAIFLFSMVGSFAGPHDGEIMGSMPDWFQQLIRNQRADMVRSDALRSLFFIIATAFFLLLYANDRLKKGVVIAVLSLLVVVDMWPVDRRFFGEQNFQTKARQQDSYAMEPYEEAILRDNDPYFRVFNLTTDAFNDSRTSYRLKSIGGYHAAKLRRYQDIITYHLSGGNINMNVVNMLNTKYLIVEDDKGGKQPLFNSEALGNAWFVDSVKIMPDAYAESQALREIDPATEAVTDMQFSDAVGSLATTSPDSTAYIQLISYSPDILEYQSHSDIEKIAIFSDIYYPYGWKAYIDGTPQPHFRADYILRAMKIPAGDHQIRFEFRPDSIFKGYIVNASAKAIILLFVLFAVVAGIRKRVTA
ncbi:MAG: hypothetical protein HUJ90_01650 [Bacteroidales bacterium]|nr:hypothetical protein [Bacteroidales bacterium]